MDWRIENWVQFFAEIECATGKSPYVMGDHWCWVDAAIAPFVRQFARTDRDWFDAQAWSALKVWLENFEQSPAYLEVMHKYKVWHQGAKLLLFLPRRQ